MYQLLFRPERWLQKALTSSEQNSDGAIDVSRDPNPAMARTAETRAHPPTPLGVFLQHQRIALGMTLAEAASMAGTREQRVLHFETCEDYRFLQQPDFVQGLHAHLHVKTDPVRSQQRSDGTENPPAPGENLSPGGTVGQERRPRTDEVDLVQLVIMAGAANGVR